VTSLSVLSERLYRVQTRLPEHPANAPAEKRGIEGNAAHSPEPLKPEAYGQRFATEQPVSWVEFLSLFSVPKTRSRMGNRLHSSDVSVWISGRWGPRRVRVDECWSILTAERVYTTLLSDPEAIRVGRRGALLYTVEDRTVTVHFEVRANAVWRFGRVFLICPMCAARATRVYLPTSASPAGCRRCWGLTYLSRQRRNYKDGEPRWSYDGLWSYREMAYDETRSARGRRVEACIKRWAERRQIRMRAEP
jgi:hypothetical protein